MAHRKKKDMNVSTTRTDSVGLTGPDGGNCLRRGLEMHQAPLPAHAQSGSSRSGKSTDPPALDLSRSASRAMIMDERVNSSEFLAGAIPMGPPSTPAAMNFNFANFPRQNFVPEQPNWNPSGFSYSQPNNLGSYGNLPYYGYAWPYSCMPFGYHPDAQQPHQWSMWNPGQFGAIAAQTSPKVYPAVPQPMYPNGQPYAGLGSYQYLAACQSFSSTVANFQANQYWKYGSWPQQPQRFVSQSTSSTPAGMITENGLRYPAHVPNEFYLTAPKPQESNEPTVEFPPDSTAETNTSSYIEEKGRVPFRSPLPPMLTPPVSDTNNGDTTVDVTRVFDTPRNSRSDGDHTKESMDAGAGQRRKQARPRRADGESTADDGEQNVDVENPKKRARRRKPSKPDDESSGPTPYKLRSGNARVTPAKPKGRPKKAKGGSNQNASKRKKAQETSEEITQIVPPGSLMLNNDGSCDPVEVEAVILHRTKQWKLNSMDGETVLHRAASLGFADFVQCILKLGLVSSPNCVNSNGLTPLHEACAQGHEQVARILLAHGAGPNKASTSGLRPLHLVHQNGHEGLAKLLIEYGAEQVV